MYEIKYDFLFCLLTYTLSFAALVLFCILTVKCLVDIFKKREIKNKIIKIFDNLLIPSVVLLTNIAVYLFRGALKYFITYLLHSSYKSLLYCDFCPSPRAIDP